MEIKKLEVPEVELPKADSFKEIKPESDITPPDARKHIDSLFDSAESERNDLAETLSDYIQDIKDKSDVPETIPENPIDVADLRKLSPEETAPLREQFNNLEFKTELKHQWEAANGQEWPKYTEDVYITNSRGEQVLIRKAGSDYDAHHIHPLSMGGKNEVSNLTPLRADVHFDHRGVHEPGSPFDQLNSILGGAN